MRTTLALDEGLVSIAHALTGLQGKSALVREAEGTHRAGECASLGPVRR
ncbi:type II toxin-antitoxin system VapB family antitoxin [Sphingomonas sp. GB1N7]